MPKSDNYVYTFITYVYHESYPHMLASFTVLATTLQLRLTLQLPSSLVPRDSLGNPYWKGTTQVFRCFRQSVGVIALANSPQRWNLIGQSLIQQKRMSHIDTTENRNEAYRSRYLALQPVEQAVAFGHWGAQANLNPVLQVILFQWSPRAMKNDNENGKLELPKRCHMARLDTYVCLSMFK